MVQKLDSHEIARNDFHNARAREEEEEEEEEGKRESGCHHQRKKTPVTMASRVFYFSVPGEEKGKRDEIHWN